ncbi:uncharacterized protein LOC135811982 isoform X3 [Sycon ciliatum]|uniref:uncharacterized protein LOC135811982 isoform X2 n=1 Tax=Sycon ciliatum TaxID=27933 RepID=UPI0031F61C08
MDMTPFYLSARPRHGINIVFARGHVIVASLTFLLLSASHLRVSDSLAVTISDDHQHERASIQRVAREVSSTSPPCSGDRSIDIYEDYCVPDSATSVLIRRIDCGTGAEIQVFPANDPNKEREPVIIGDEYGVSLFNPGRFVGTSYFRCIARPLAPGGRYGEATFIVKPNGYIEGICDIVTNGGCPPLPTTPPAQRTKISVPPIRTTPFSPTVPSSVTTAPQVATPVLSKPASTTNVDRLTASSEATKATTILATAPGITSASTKGQDSYTTGIPKGFIALIIMSSIACIVCSVLCILHVVHPQRNVEETEQKAPPETPYDQEARSPPHSAQYSVSSNSSSVSCRTSPDHSQPWLANRTSTNLSPEARKPATNTTEANSFFTSAKESVQPSSETRDLHRDVPQHNPHVALANRRLHGVYDESSNQQHSSELAVARSPSSAVELPCHINTPP